MVRQIEHTRRSKKGKRFMAGSRRPEVTAKLKREIMREHVEDLQKQLKQQGRVRIPEIGVLRIRIKKARKAKWGTNPFTGERMKFKAKPRTKIVKFRAAKALKEVMA